MCVSNLNVMQAIPMIPPSMVGSVGSTGMGQNFLALNETIQFWGS